MNADAAPTASIELRELTAVIPAFNEEASIAAVVQQVRGQGIPVIVVDDASTDNTAAAARAAGASVLPLPLRMGAWAAMQAGIQQALRDGAQYIVTLDGDGQHQPEDIAALYAAVRADAGTGTANASHCAGCSEDIGDAGGVDCAIGSCPQRGSPARQVAWFFFRTLTGLRIRDLTSGFRVYNRRAARCLVRKEAMLSDYQDIGVLLLLRRYGMCLREVPVTMLPRSVGKSHVFSSWGKVVYYMIYSFVVSCSRR